VKQVQVRDHRNDIDGLRAIAVLAVIAFHFGYLPNGYLGVDVFLVISGYLITGIVYNELTENRFSIVNFYLRRTRRIIPLALFISFVALAVGVATMLPDDLENAAQSVIATNLFSNNILQAVTTKNYWDVVNEYKPLMHTWSLGIEEQYYLFYPLLFVIVAKKGQAWLRPLLFFLTTASLVLFMLPLKEYEQFYLIPFRFFELALGGIAAIALKNKLLRHRFSPFLVLLLILLLCVDFYFIPRKLVLLLTVLLTLGIVVSSNDRSRLSSLILENKPMVALGMISFSLYMWHQVLLAYSRYFLFQELHAPHLIGILVLTFVLSVISYRLIEQPFRNKNRITTRNLLLSLSLSFVIVNAVASYVYFRAGVLRDVPELDIQKSQVERNMHARYNSRIYDYDRDFKSTEAIKVLVIGNSFARDWVNVLLESKYRDYLDISYTDDPANNEELDGRVKEADIVFYYNAAHDDIKTLGINENKLWIIGTKNFGASSGIFYNYRGVGYCEQRTSMIQGILEQNSTMREEWGDKYIDFVGKTMDAKQTVPVFTPDCRFISQDTRHLTRAGALYFAHLFEDDLASILDQVQYLRQTGTYRERATIGC
jgi:peptidoglycan/LPS O-acetylase OafA/YrhL